MKPHALRTLSACALASAMLGCGMTGTWSSESLDPEMARDEFAMFGRKPYGAEFTRAELTLRDDGTYMATVHYGDVAAHSNGTWEQDGRKVTFVDQEGISRTYDTNLSSDHKQLMLVRSIEGTDVRLVMKRKS